MHKFYPVNKGRVYACLCKVYAVSCRVYAVSVSYKGSCGNCIIFFCDFLRKANWKNLFYIM